MKETQSCDTREHKRALNRERQVRYREKRKREGQSVDNAEKKSRKRQTRGEHEKLKEEWRIAKRKQRHDMSIQKKRRLREKERHRYAEKTRQKERKTSDVRVPAAAAGIISPSAIKQRAHRLKRSLPESPTKFARVIKHVVDNATPRKKICLRTVGVTNRNSPLKAKRALEEYVGAIRQSFDELRTKRLQQWAMTRRCLAISLKSRNKAVGMRTTAKDTGISYNFLRKYSSRNFEDVSNMMRKRRKDAIGHEVIAKVEEYFHESASCVPDMKAVNKRTMKSSKVLSEPVSELYVQFKEKNPAIRLTRAQFHKLRPKDVKTTHYRKLYQSRCEHCSNPKLKLDALNKACDHNRTPDCKIKSNTDLIAITMCPKQPDASHHRMACIQRQCRECGPQAIEQHTAALASTVGDQEQTWQFWTTKDYINSNQKTSKQKVLESKSGSMKELVTGLQNDTRDLSHHLLVAQWQKTAFDILSKDVPVDSIVLHMDFSENYSTFYQQEISSAHWMKNLITIHPVVAFYNCQQCESSTRPIMDVLIFISDDNQHDHHAVQAFFSKTVEFLRVSRGVSFAKVFEFTDGCSSQYKSRGPLVDISFGYEDFRVTRERVCFGSCHGKGPCDAAGGVVKKSSDSRTSNHQQRHHNVRLPEISPNTTCHQ